MTSRRLAGSFRRAAVAALAAAFVGLPWAGAAQERADPARVWVGLGLGTELHDGASENFAVLAQAVYQQRAHHIALRALGAADPFGSSGNSVIDLGLLYGRVLSPEGFGHAVIAAGVGVVGINDCSLLQDAEGCGDQTVGVPITAELALTPLPVLGVGVQGYANLNPHGGVRRRDRVPAARLAALGPTPHA